MSKQIKCKSCGAEIIKKAKTCPQCGEPNKQKSYWWLVILLLLFIIAAVLIWFWLMKTGNKSENENPVYACQNAVIIIAIVILKKRTSEG